MITSFGVANAISIPITGWLAKRIGEVRLFVWSTIAFALASFLCGVANSLTTLILFRVIQGLVAGPLIPLSQSLLLSNYPPAKRSIALSLWAMTVVVAPICGPILGGWISDNYHWGWIFFINVPIGIVVTILTLQTLRNRETKTEIRPIDTVGLVLLVVGIGALQIMLDRGRELDWFSSTEIIVLTVVAVVALSVLFVWEMTDDHPVVDLTLFKSRNFTIGCLSISLAYMLYFGSIVLLPQLLQEVYGYTATGGAGFRAGGNFPGDFVADYRPLRPPHRYAQAGDLQLYYVCRLLLLARTDLRAGNGLRRVGMAAVHPGTGGGLLLYAVDHHYAIGAAAGAARRSVQPVELLAYRQARSARRSPRRCGPTANRCTTAISANRLRPTAAMRRRPIGSWSS